MNTLVLRALAVAGGILCASSAPAAGADIIVLDKPGAVHLKPAATTANKPPGFSVIPQAQAAIGSPSNTLQIPAVRLNGYFMPGDADKMRTTLEALAAYPAAKGGGPLTTVEFSSPGGSLLEGFEIGGLLRKFNLVGVVRSRDLCLSSCALALVGGNVQDVPQSYPTRCNIELGGKVGFHNFFLNATVLRDSTENDPVVARMQGFADARGGAASLVKYAAQMGLPPSFVASLIGRPPDQFQYVETVGQFLSLGVCPIGLTRPSIAIEEQAKNICSNSMRHADLDPDLQVRLLPAPQVKRYLLERVQAQIVASRARGRLAGLLANASVMRVTEEIDHLYNDLRGAGMALPELVGPTFEVLLKRGDVVEPACYVSLSTDDPDVFDVAISGQKGLTEPVYLPPENARRLFLFAKSTVVNPRPPM